MTPDARGRVRPAPRRPPLHIVLAFLAISACHPKPATVATPPTLSGAVAGLGRTVDRLIADPALERGSWGIVVRSMDRGETLYELNARKLLMPASTLKIVTLARAAERLGWNYRYRTALMTVGEVVDGTLTGHVIVRGCGDPTIDDWTGTATAIFDDWAARLKREGIHRIAGKVIGDDDFFDDEIPADGWVWDDLGLAYGAQVSGLQFNENAAQLFLTPSTKEGDPATLEIRPSFAPVVLSNRTISAGVDPSFLNIRADALTIRPDLRSGTIVVDGLVPFKGGTIRRTVAVSNPTLYFATAVREALIRNGIDVSGPAADEDDRDPDYDHSASRLIAEHQSAPLSEIAGTMMKLSQNLFAETILKSVNEPGKDSGSAGLALEDIERTLPSWGIAPADVHMVDGSGLSRYDVMTADAMVAVLAHVWNDERLRETFIQTLPVAGVDGTLEHRMKATPAAGNARAKTGSFSNARCLAGFVRSADGEMLAFTVFANNYGVPPPAVDKATDAIVVALAQFTRR